MGNSGLWAAFAGSSIVGLALIALGPVPAAAAASLPALLCLPVATLVPALIVSLGFAPLFGAAYIVAAMGTVFSLVVVLARGNSARSPASIPLLALVSWICFSLVWTDAPLWRAVVALSPSLVLLAGLRVWPLSVDKALRCLVAAGCLQAGLTLVAALQQAGRVTETGPYALPMTVVGGVAAFGLALSTHGHHRRRFLMASGLNVLGIVATETRGMFVGFVIGALALLVVQRGKTTVLYRRRALSGAILVTAGVALGLAITSEGGNVRFRPDSVSAGAEGRTEELRAAAGEVGKSPIIGHGVGHLFANPIVGIQEYVTYAHNSIVYFLIATGLVGGALFVYSAAAVYRHLRHAGPSGVIASCAFASLLAFSLTAALQRTLHFNILIAMFAGLGSTRQRESS